MNNNLRGALLMSIAMAGFTCSDALSKVALGSIGIGQMLVVRGIFASLLIGAIAWRTGAFGKLSLLVHPTITLRALGEAGAAASFLTALAHMPLGNVSAILQALPLAVTVGAAFFLGEPVGWRRWLAICVGFAGVLVIVRPSGEGFDSYSLYALACVVMCAFRDIVTHRAPANIPSFLMATATAVSVTLMGVVFATVEADWRPMDVDLILVLFAAAILVNIGYQAITLSVRQADMSFIAPFRYTGLLWALFLGYVVFGDIPAATTLVGAAIVIASGLYTLYRETVIDATRPVTISSKDAGNPEGL